MRLKREAAEKAKKQANFPKITRKIFNNVPKEITHETQATLIADLKSVLRSTRSTSNRTDIPDV
jgi:hypothetical protein